MKNWQDHAMAVRWVAASLLDMEKRFKRIMGYQQLRMLEAKLKDLAEDETVDAIPTSPETTTKQRPLNS